ncbi:MAG TPA: hypothetical protein VF198_08655 [Vicinamibacterales bacterium]
MEHLLIVMAVLVLAAPAAAQGPAPTAVAVEQAPVYVAPDVSRTPLRVAAQGTVFKVLAEEGEWTRVQFQDPQWGPRTGYVQTRALRFQRPDLTPMDLSVREDQPVSPPAPRERYAVEPPFESRPPVRIDRSVWPRAYAVGRGGVTFGTRTAPMAGVEVGGHVAPMLQVYGSFDWHRDISPDFVKTVGDIVSEIVGLEVNYRFPSYTLVGGGRVMMPGGPVRPYALGGFGMGRVSGIVEVEGEDVTGLLDELGFLDRDDVEFIKPLFEVGGGIAISNGAVFADIGYRFRKFLDTNEPINVSGIYLGAGVGF